jgi:curved DNA-binding protein CbpA
MSDHYKTLEVDNNATTEEIKSAYRRLAKKYHPDKNNTEKAELIFKEINKAYEVLSNPEKKLAYDGKIAPSADFISKEGVKYRPVYKRPQYTESAKRKGKIFIWALSIIAVVVPLFFLRYSSKYNYDEGLEYFQNGEIGRSLISFDYAIKEFGSHKKEASLKAIEICYERGYISQGIAFAQKGLRYIYNKKIKGNLSYREGLGWEMLGQLEKSDVSFKKALDWGYQEDSLYIHLGMLHGFELENYDEAVSYFTYLIDSAGLQEFKLQRGITFQNLGKNNLAINDLNRFIQSNPKNGMGHFFLGISLADMERIVDACESFSKARELGVDQSHAYLDLHCMD